MGSNPNGHVDPKAWFKKAYSLHFTPTWVTDGILCVRREALVFNPNNNLEVEHHWKVKEIQVTWDILTDDAVASTLFPADAEWVAWSVTDFLVDMGEKKIARLCVSPEGIPALIDERAWKLFEPFCDKLWSVKPYLDKDVDQGGGFNKSLSSGPAAALASLVVAPMRLTQDHWNQLSSIAPLIAAVAEHMANTFWHPEPTQECDCGTCLSCSNKTELLTTEKKLCLVCRNAGHRVKA